MAVNTRPTEQSAGQTTDVQTEQIDAAEIETPDQVIATGLERLNAQRDDDRTRYERLEDSLKDHMVTAAVACEQAKDDGDSTVLSLIWSIRRDNAKTALHRHRHERTAIQHAGGRR